MSSVYGFGLQNPYDEYNPYEYSSTSEEFEVIEQSQNIPQNVFIYSIDGGLICKDELCTSTTNAKAQLLYKTIKKIYQFFAEEFSLYGIDGNGNLAPIQIGWDEDNAMWTCSSYMDGKKCSWVFNDKYVSQPKVVAHEYMHAIISSFTSLGRTKESGALHESLGDIFGIAFEKWLTGRMNWTIHGRNIRSIPSLFFSTHEIPNINNDYGFVHQNSSIPSHAFYEAVQRSGTKSWEVITQIWFRAMLKMNFNETFSSFAKKTVKEAQTFSSDRELNKALKNIVASSWRHLNSLKEVMV